MDPLLKHGKERTAGAPGFITHPVTSVLLNREDFLFPVSPATIPRDLLEPLPKGTFSIGEMEQYDRYKTTHDSITFGPDNEDEQREETDEPREEHYARLSPAVAKVPSRCRRAFKKCCWQMAQIT